MSTSENSEASPPSPRQQEFLFKQLRDMSQGADAKPMVPRQDMQTLHLKVDEWEQSYQALRGVEDSLVRAYSDLSE